MKKILSSAVLTLGLAASFAVSAQQTQDTTPQQGAPQVEGKGHRMGRMHGGGMGRGGMRKHREGMMAFGQLNLTDAQKERMRSIHQTAMQSMQPKREELRQIMMTKRQGGQLTTQQETRAKQLHEELREARRRTHEEALSVLTTEQRAQLDKMKQERKARRGEMRKRHEQMREGKDQTPPQQ